MWLFKLFVHFLKGTNRFFSKVAATQMGIEVEYVDATDLTKLQDAIKPTTKVLQRSASTDVIR